MYSNDISEHCIYIYIYICITSCFVFQIWEQSSDNGDPPWGRGDSKEEWVWCDYCYCYYHDCYCYYYYINYHHHHHHHHCRPPNRPYTADGRFSTGGHFSRGGGTAAGQYTRNLQRIFHQVHLSHFKRELSCKCNKITSGVPDGQCHCAWRWGSGHPKSQLKI